MSDAILAIKRRGNSLGVRLPAAVAREARLRAVQSPEPGATHDCH